MSAPPIIRRECMCGSFQRSQLLERIEQAVRKNAVSSSTVSMAILEALKALDDYEASRGAPCASPAKPTELDIWPPDWTEKGAP